MRCLLFRYFKDNLRLKVNEEYIRIVLIYLVEKPLYFILDHRGCSCSSYVDPDYGWGNCQKSYGKGPICYVNEPSTCTDIVDARSYGPTGYSWEACANKNLGTRAFHSGIR